MAALVVIIQTTHVRFVVTTLVEVFVVVGPIELFVCCRNRPDIKNLRTGGCQHVCWAHIIHVPNVVVIGFVVVVAVVVVVVLFVVVVVVVAVIMCLSKQGIYTRLSR